MELKPCPFCGCIIEETDAVSNKPRGIHLVFYSVKCPMCKVKGPSSAIKYIDDSSLQIDHMFDKAITAWNKRS